MKSKQKNKFILSSIIFFTVLIFLIIFLVMSEHLISNQLIKALVTIITLSIIIISAIVISKIEHEVTVYKCKHCQEHFVPKFSEHILGMRIKFINQLKYLKCSKCGKKSWCERKFK